MSETGKLIIANPLYDTAFKFLMEDLQLARKFLSILLSLKIVQLNFAHQEVVVPGEAGELKVFRLDFRATVELADGSMQQICIELQKSKKSDMIERFRDYLGVSYSHFNTFSTDDAQENPPITEEPLPIITIYLLGFTIPDLPTAVAHVKRQIFDKINATELKVLSNFVNLLTHECYIVQLPRLEGSKQTELEEILDIFNQKYIEDMKQPMLLNFTEKAAHPLVKEMAQRLAMAASDHAIRRQLHAEAQHERYLKRLEWETKNAQAETEKVLLAKEKVEQEKEKVEQEKEKVEQEKEKAEFRISELLETQQKMRTEQAQIVAKMQEEQRRLLEMIEKLQKDKQ